MEGLHDYWIGHGYQLYSVRSSSLHTGIVNSRVEGVQFHRIPLIFGPSALGPSGEQAAYEGIYSVPEMVVEKYSPYEDSGQYL